MTRKQIATLSTRLGWASLAAAAVNLAYSVASLSRILVAKGYGGGSKYKGTPVAFGRNQAGQRHLDRQFRAQCKLAGIDQTRHARRAQLRAADPAYMVANYLHPRRLRYQ